MLFLWRNICIGHSVTSAGRRLEWGLGRAAATICHALKEVKQNAIYNVTSFFSSVSDLAIILGEGLAMKIYPSQQIVGVILFDLF